MAIRVGIVGLGMAVTPHAKSLLDLKDRVEVAYAFSPSAARREKFASQFKFKLCDRLETILADRSVGAVLILTPPSTHLDLTEQCAVAGKHVLLEKPLEISTARAERMVEVFSKKKLKLGIVLQHRFRPAAEKLHEILPSLGRIVSASAMVPNWRPQSYYDQPGRGTKARDGGGVLLTQAIHLLDLMLALAGPASSVTAFCRTSPLRAIDTEDIASAAVQFANGAVGVVDATTAAYPGYTERLELAGTLGSAVLEGERLTLQVKGAPVEIINGSTSGGGGADPMAFSHEPHRRLIEDFVDAVREGREPMVSGRSALAVHALIDAMLESSAAGRPVAVEPTE